MDASALAADLASFDRLADRNLAAAAADARTVADLIVDQIEFADTLILNKCDLVSEVMGKPGMRQCLFQGSAWCNVHLRPWDRRFSMQLSSGE